MRIECKECGCTPKPDEWAYEGSDYCIDCSIWTPPLQLEVCSACKGNGYLRQNMVEIHQCTKCKSQGEVYA